MSDEAAGAAKPFPRCGNFGTGPIAAACRMRQVEATADGAIGAGDTGVEPAAAVTLPWPVTVSTEPHTRAWGEVRECAVDAFRLTLALPVASGQAVTACAYCTASRVTTSRSLSLAAAAFSGERPRSSSWSVTSHRAAPQRGAVLRAASSGTRERRTA